MTRDESLESFMFQALLNLFLNLLFEPCEVAKEFIFSLSRGGMSSSRLMTTQRMTMSPG